MKPHIRWYSVLRTWQCTERVKQSESPDTLYQGSGTTPQEAYQQCEQLIKQRQEEPTP